MRLTRELVKLERKRNYKEEELVANGDEERNGEIVIVEYMDLHFDEFRDSENPRSRKVGELQESLGYVDGRRLAIYSGQS